MRADLPLAHIPSPPTRADRLPVLDGWRGVAILLVFCGHFFPVAGINLGQLGVDFFFVLSGRLMAEILFARETALPLFFQRRVSRVYPGLIAFTLLAAVAFRSSFLRVGPLQIVCALSFTNNYLSGYIRQLHDGGMFEHLWSLCVEEHCYLILGAVAYAGRRYGAPTRAMVLALGLAGLANGIIQSDVFGRGYYEVFWRTDTQMAVIVLAASAFLNRERLTSSPLARSAPLLVALAIACKFQVFGVAALFGLGTIYLAIAVNLLETAPGWFQTVLSFAPLRQIGIWSYSLYLWQQPFYKLHDAGYGNLALPAAILCGVASFHYIEQPARRFLNRRLRSVELVSVR